MAWSHTGTPTLANVEIKDDVTLGGTGAGLTIYRTFTHTAGLLDFSDRDITIDNITADIDAVVAGAQAAAGTYTNVAGTYDATTGWLNIHTTAFDQGANNFTIPNLRFGANAAATVAAQSGVVTVLTELECGQPGVVDIQDATNTSGAIILAVDSAATVTHKGVTATAFDVAPTFIGTITLVAENTAAATIDATIWPATPANLVTTFVVNSAAARDTYLPGDRTVSHELDLYVGDLDLDANNLAGTDDRTLTLSNSIIKVRENGILDEGNGSFVYTDPDVFYQLGAAYNTFTNGTDFTPVNNLTVETYNAAGGTVTIGSSVTVKGDLIVNAPMTTAAAATISLHGDAIIATAVNVGGTVAFVGETEDQKVQVPAAGANFGNLIINKLAGNVVLEGGNLSLVNAVTAYTMTFLRGLFLTGDNVLVLNRPGPGAVQGFAHTPMNGYMSHVVGSVALNPRMNPSPAFGRNEWPVGSMTEYRPASLTFLNTVATPLGVNITIEYVDTKPAGIVGLPIQHGEKSVARYPDFYWNIASAASLSQIEFDLELSATGFTSWGDAYEDIVILRRNGADTDIENTWVLQGEDYDNFLTDGSPTVINRNSRGGLRSEGAIFAYGLPTRMFTNATLGNKTIGLETIEIDVAGIFGGFLVADETDLTFQVSTTNQTVVEVPADDFTGTTKFELTGLADGTATITIRATDSNGDFITTSFDIEVDAAVALEEDLGIPTEYQLAQNFPNPFNPTTKIRFGLPEASSVVLKVYNILGEEVAKLVNQELQAGFHTFNFDASQLSSGLYIYRIEAGNFVEVKKMMLMK